MKKGMAWLLTGSLLLGSVSPVLAEESVLIVEDSFEEGGILDDISGSEPSGPEIVIEEIEAEENGSGFEELDGAEEDESGAFNDNSDAGTGDASSDAVDESISDIQSDNLYEESSEAVSELSSDAVSEGDTEGASESMTEEETQDMSELFIVEEAEVDETLLYHTDEEEEETDYTCGNGLEWRLENGRLTIYYTGSGTGYMHDWTYISDSGEDETGAEEDSGSSEDTEAEAEEEESTGSSAEDVPPWTYADEDDDGEFDEIRYITIGAGVRSIGECAFADLSDVVSVSMADSVSTIGDNAFADCVSLSKVTLSQGLTMIGKDAFADCCELSAVTLPDSVQTIGEYAFSGTSLSSITIPDGVQAVEQSTFLDCESLETVNLPESVTSIGIDAFSGCILLSNFTIPSAVTSIGDGAFAGCLSLSDDNLILPSGLAAIEDTTFYGCVSLTSITIPAGVKSIGDEAFYECGNLTAVTFEDESVLNSIGVSAFSCCSRLADIVIPAGVNEIGDYAFAYNPEFIAPCFEGSVPEKWGASVFEEYNENFHVFFIEDQEGWTKENWTAQGEVDETYPSGLWGGKCGSSSENLENVQWRFWFGDCTLDMYGTGDTSSWIDTEVPWITCFDYISKVRIGEGITYLGDGAFKGCLALGEISFPETLVTIGVEAFSDTAIAELNLPSELKGIASKAFYGCDILKEVTIPASVTGVAAEAFAECYHLSEVTFLGEENEAEDAALTIGEKAFYKCPHLQNAVFERKAPDTFGNNVFAECKQENNAASSLDEQIGFIITYKADRDGWTAPYYNYTKDDGAQKYKSESDKFSFWRDVWSFENSYSDFRRYTSGYFITEADYQRLTSKMLRNERSHLNVYEEKDDDGNVIAYKECLDIDGRYRDDDVMPWGGSCYGLSAWTALLQNGVLSLSDLSSGASALKEISMSQQIESAINYYYIQQRMLGAIDAEADFKSLSSAAQAQHLYDLMKHASETGELAMINFIAGDLDDSGNLAGTWAHSVIGYGLEEGSFAVTVNGSMRTYGYRALIYDCSYLDPSNVDPSFKYSQAACHLYFNMDGTWCIPKYNLSFTSKDGAVTGSNNGLLTLVSNSDDVLNMVDYNTGNLSALAEAQSADHAYLDTSGSANYQVSFDGKTSTVQADSFMTGADANGVTVVPMVGDGVTSRVTGMTARVPLSQSGYTVQTDDASFAYGLVYGDYYEKVTASSPGEVVFEQAGSVSVALEQPGSYDLTITANDGCTDLPWHTVTITGDNVTEVSAEMTDEGVKVSGDNLEALDITVTSDSSEKTVTVKPESENLIIKGESGSSTPDIYEDSNGDGTYDKPVGIVHTYGKPVFTWSEDYRTVTAAFTCPDSDCPDVQTLSCTVTSKTTASTCTKEGKTVYTAAVKFEGVSYSDVRTAVIGKKPHTYGAWAVTKAATALETGIRKKSCSCGAYVTETLARLQPTMTVNAKSLLLKVKQSTKALKVTGLAAGDRVASWTSSNKKIVTVTGSGKITAKNKTGKATITIKLASGLRKEIPVTVQKKAVTTKKITGLKKSVTLKRGATLSLEPVIEPITSSQKVTYSSSNKKVATVTSKGKITAKSAGTVKITVKSGSKKFTVKVTVPKVKTTAIKGVVSEKTLKKGKTFTLKPKLMPSYSGDKITYKSSNKKVATVSSKGKVTAKKAGTAVITVTSGKVKVQCTVTVK